MKTMIINIVFVLIISMLFGGCANNPQLALRGNPNSPWVSMQYLRIDPNAMMHMSKYEYDELVRRVDEHNRIVSVMLQNDRTAAQNAQIWTGNVNQDRYYSPDNILMRNLNSLFERWVYSIDF